MAKDRYPKITKALTEALEKLDLDGLAYYLSQVVVAKRNEADEGTNRDEKAYWQRAVEATLDFCRKVENLWDEPV